METLVYIFVWIPFALVMLFQDKLNSWKPFLLIAFLSIIWSCLSYQLAIRMEGEVVGVLMMFCLVPIGFVISYSLIGIPYKKLFSRNLVVGHGSPWIDILFGMVVIGGTILIPFFIDCNFLHILCK